MARQQVGLDVSFRAPYDVSAYQYYFVKMSSTDDYIAICSAGSNQAVGILQNKPDTAGAEALVRCLGHSKVVASGDLDVGNALGPDTSGKAQAVTTASGQTDTIMGIMTAGTSNDGEIGEMLLVPVVTNI